MQITAIAQLGGAAAIGLLLGFIFGAMGKKKKISQLKERHAEFEKKLEGAKKESGDVKALKKTNAQLEEQLKDAKQKLADAEAALTQHKDQLKKASSALTAVETAHARAEQQLKAAETARQQAEVNQKQHQEQLSALQGTLAGIEKEQTNLQNMVRQRTEELQRLRSLAQRGTSSGGSTMTGIEGAMEVFASGDGTIAGILKLLQEREQQRMVILADGNGIAVAAAGEPQLKEGMAAASRIITGVGSQLSEMVPFGQIKAFSLRDEKGVIVGRTFVCSGEPVSLATFGNHPPDDVSIDGAMANLSSILG